MDDVIQLGTGNFGVQMVFCKFYSECYPYDALIIGLCANFCAILDVLRLESLVLSY